MGEVEGVVKYSLLFEDGAPPSQHDVARLNYWRKICMLLGLVGQDDERYDGYGFGNLSRLLSDEIVITGTQTGGVEDLTPEHYARVTQWNFQENSVVGVGKTKPSSEVLTHASVYAHAHSCRYCFHVHSPDIWQYAEELGLPITDRSVPYGTPAMAEEVSRLFRETDVRDKRAFVMGGHEDGVMFFGASADLLGSRLVACLTAALYYR